MPKGAIRGELDSGVTIIVFTQLSPTISTYLNLGKGHLYVNWCTVCAWPQSPSDSAFD